jgi:hypothetical protein
VNVRRCGFGEGSARLRFEFRLGFFFGRCEFLRSFDWLDDLYVFDQARPDLRCDLFRKVLETNTLGYFMRNCIGRHTAIDTLATRIFHDLLIVELQLFREVVDSYLLVNCRHI